MIRRILLVEPFFGGSHAAWAQGWRAASRHDIHLVTHEASAWRWRMRGAAVTLARRTEEWVERHGRPDVVVATDMLDLAAYLGLARRPLGDVPVALYLHENQLTYPRRPDEPLDQGLAWATWRSLVSADVVWSNSAFHRDELFAALPAFLRSVPDHDHEALLGAVHEKVSVLPVGVDLEPIANPVRQPVGPAGPLVLSNQRWHHDKDLGAVVRALLRIAATGTAFRVALAGDDTGGEREALLPLIDALGERVEHVGHLERHDYRRLLERSDIVVSAARNEFFGIAVVEALAAGAIPVLPEALAYPEVLPRRFHRCGLYGAGALTASLSAAISSPDDHRRECAGLADAVRRFDWSVVAPDYDRAVDALAAR